MLGLLKRIAKRLLFGAGIVVILIAIGVGGFRVLIAQIPSYQTELQAWVAAELGIVVDFGELDARWGLRGPELTLHDARIGSRTGVDAFVSAERAAVTLDPWQLLLERKPSVSRLTLEGVRLTVERTGDGRFRVQGVPARSGAFELDSLVPSEVEVTVRDGRVQFVDALRGRGWEFDDVTINLSRGRDGLAVAVRAQPPPELASRLEVSLEAAPGSDGSALEWSLYGVVRDGDLGALALFAPGPTVYAVAGAGDATILVEGAAARISRATATLGLHDVVLPGGAAPFERVRLAAEWSRDTEKGWQAALSGVDIVHDGRRWPAGGNTTLTVRRIDGELDALTLRSDYLRLDDVADVARSLPSVPPVQPWLEPWLELNPRGELRAVDFAFAQMRGDWDYSLAARFENLGLDSTRGRPGFGGLSGELKSDSRNGTVEFASTDFAFDWPRVFPRALMADSLTGTVVWRQGRNVVRVVSSDLTIGLLGSAARSSLELTLPLDGTSPRLDMETLLPEADLVAAKRYLPTLIMPEPVAQWLDRAIQGGSGRDIEFSFFGSLADFPFDDGDGQFRVGARVRDARLDYAPDWPTAENLDGTIEFTNASFAAAGSGDVLGNHGRNLSIGIADLRRGVLTLTGRTEGPLADVVGFLRAAPQIADHLGPGYERLQVHAGTGAVDMDLTLPLLERSTYAFEGSLAIEGADLSVDGFSPHATEIAGRLAIDGATVTADGIEAEFLGGPATARVLQPDEPGYRARLAVDGETTAAAVIDAFKLPFDRYVAGQTRWHGSLLLPSREADEPGPPRVEVESNLTGVSLKFPAPFAKGPAEPSNLGLEFVFSGDGRLLVDGNLGATRRFALRYGIAPDGGAERFVFDRGALEFGGDRPDLPREPGLRIDGSLPELHLDDWLGFARASSGAGTRALWRGARLDLAEFFAFGQQLGSTQLEVRPDGSAWAVDIQSEAIAGHLAVPARSPDRLPIVADMERLYLATGAGSATQGAEIRLGEALDPRTLPGLSLHSREFGIGSRRFGEVEAEVVPDPLGLRLASFASTGEGFTLGGSGSWLDGARGGVSQIALTLHSSDVAATLEALGIGAFLVGESADVTASVHWPGPPSGRWMDHVGGDVALHVEKGSMLDIEPGAGRVVGLMSVAALPRRLALDFRDVFNKGFVFDEIGGDFRLIDGNAYTDNLKLSGPGAEIGLVGRTGLRDRDYQQQAVVTAEPSNVLPTVGGLLAGAGVGAALLIFTQIFKEPLKGIGRASYCITGTWDEPEVERITADRAERAEQCAALPPGELAMQR